MAEGLGVQGTCTLAWQADLLNPFSTAQYSYIYAPGTSLAWDAYPNLLNSSFSFTSGVPPVSGPALPVMSTACAAARLAAPACAAAHGFHCSGLTYSALLPLHSSSRCLMMQGTRTVRVEL